MPKYVASRLGALFPTLLGIATLSFFLVNLAPGGPVEQKVLALRLGSHQSNRASVTNSSGQVSAETLRALNKQYGFDRPPLERFTRWLRALVYFDFGVSSIYQRPARDVIFEHAPLSVALGLAAFGLTYLLSVMLGLWMGHSAGSTFERTAGFSLVLLAALPAFIMGVLLLLGFAGDGIGRWFPLGYIQSDDYATMTLFRRIFDRAWHCALPLACYVLGALTLNTQLQRNATLDELGQDYVRTARAKGVGPRQILWRHVLPNALVPLVSGLGGTLAFFLGGSILVESLFQLNGLGFLALQATLSRDTNLVMALLIFGSALLLVGNFAGDMIMAWLNPRVRFGEKN